MKQTGINKWMVYGLPAFVLLIMLLAILTPKPIDWSLSYSQKHSKPFGTAILFELIPELMFGEDVKTAHSSIFQVEDKLHSDAINYLIINKEFSPDKTDLDAILRLAKYGNSVFVSAEYFSLEFMDSLGVRGNSPRLFGDLTQKVDSVSFNFANRRLKTQLGYWYQKAISDNTFARYDTLQTTVLGYNNWGDTNFIRIKRGDGFIYLHLNPLVFTNYNLLVQDNYQYVCKCLSYLPTQTTYWDEYYKISRPQSKGLLDFVLTRRSLRYAWYLLAFGVFLFFVFETSRRQRIIPLVKQPENSTVSFVQTVGRLYYSRKNHLDIGQKKYTYFQDFVRTKYYIDTQNKGSDLFGQLASKSGIEERRIKQLFDMGQMIEKGTSLSEEGLQQFDQRMAYFYEHCK